MASPLCQGVVYPLILLALVNIR